MRAWRISRFGNGGLERVELPEPVPGRREVLLRVRAASLNYRDWLMAQGEYNPRQKLPLIPLSDGAGEVVATGEDVTRVAAGDRACGIFSQTWISGPPTRDRLSGTLGGPRDGMLCDLAVLHEDGVVKTPSHLSDFEAASLPCAGVTAWNALVEQGRIRSGETVVVQGTGGVSIFALQFAKLCGARVIVTSSSDEKLARARALGAWATLNYRDDPEWDRSVKRLTAIGADHVVEVGGAATLERSLRAVRVGGTVSIIGVLSGKTASVPLTPVLMQNLRLQGVVVGSRDVFESMNRAIAANELRPVIDRVFPFDDAPAAFDYLAGGRHFGKICIEI